VRFEVLMVIKVKIAIFWDVAPPCYVVDSDRVMEAISSSGTPVSIYQSA
jgi:hypothetical protein